jgi:hypothetical protein
LLSVAEFFLTLYCPNGKTSLPEVKFKVFHDSDGGEP